MGLTPQGMGMGKVLPLDPAHAMALPHRAWDDPMEMGVDALGSVLGKVCSAFCPHSLLGSQLGRSPGTGGEAVPFPASKPQPGEGGKAHGNQSPAFNPP